MTGRVQRFDNTGFERRIGAGLDEDAGVLSTIQENEGPAVVAGEVRRQEARKAVRPPADKRQA